MPPIARRAKRITSGAGLDGMLARSVAKINKTISDGGITVDVAIIKVHTSN